MRHIAPLGEVYNSTVCMEPLFLRFRLWLSYNDRYRSALGNCQGEAPAVFDMAVDGNSHLYIGGTADAVSGLPARNIAYWDGETWHALKP